MCTNIFFPFVFGLITNRVHVRVCVHVCVHICVCVCLWVFTCIFVYLNNFNAVILITFLVLYGF